MVVKPELMTLRTMLSQEDGKHECKHHRNESGNDVIDLEARDFNGAHIPEGSANWDEESKPAGQDGVEEEEKEKLVIAEANGVSNPGAEVIHLQNAMTRHRA